MTHLLSQIIACPSDFVGRRVTLEGRLFVKFYEAFIAVSEVAYGNGEYLQIHDGPLMAQEMLNGLPPLGGGKHIFYDEQVEIDAEISNLNSQFFLIPHSYHAQHDGFEVNVER